MRRAFVAFLAAACCAPLPLSAAAPGASSPLVRGLVWRSAAAICGCAWPIGAPPRQPRLACRRPSLAAASGALLFLPCGPDGPVVSALRRPRLARLCPLLAAGVGASLPPLGGRGWRIIAPRRLPRRFLLCREAVASASLTRSWRLRLAIRYRPLLAAVCGQPLPLPGGRGSRISATSARPRLARSCPSPAAAVGVLPFLRSGWGGTVSAPPRGPQPVRRCHSLAPLCGAQSPLSAGLCGPSLPFSGGRGWRVATPPERPRFSSWLSLCW